jgi:ABC-2 type transport system permease protein
MKALLLREIKSFFGSPIGYLVIAIFLLLNGLFLWVFDGDFNILNAGYADLGMFFKISPYIFVFLIPAITMKSFSEEKKQGTLEILFTKPITVWQITLGKFFGAFFLIILALIPTLLYVYVVSSNTNMDATFDYGSTIGSYIGLLFLAASYSAIGIFTSTLSENQIVAFIYAVFLCFLMYFGFKGLSGFSAEFGNFIAMFGIDYHYNSISRGVIDTRDTIYFISIIFLFLVLTVFQLNSLKK